MPKGSCVLDSIRKLGWSSMPNIRSWLITIQSYFDDIPIKPLYTRTRYYLFGVWIGQRFLERMKFFPRAKDLNCERSPRTNVSITEVYYLVMYIISQVRVRRTSPVRNYLRLHGAYVTRPHELTFSGHVGNQFWIKPRVGTKNWVCTHSSKEETISG